jgi:UDP-N-acetylmuramyl pentapeptide phosphotransferase/UDP-N-acetylglucosamine-1-phosphate transferase
MAAGIIITVWSGIVYAPPVLTVLAAGLVVAGVGLRDDVSSLSAAPKLIAQVLAAGAVVWMLGGFVRAPLPAPLDVPLGWIGVPLAVVWIVGVTNFFNFMDGADGLAGGQAGLTFAVMAWAVWPDPVAVVSILAVSATAAFLIRNWAPARIFFGDVGSGWAGFLLAALPFAAPVEVRGSLVLLVATSLALFLVDPALTLARRFAGGRQIGAAHREHAYQQLIDPAQSHAGGVARLLLAAASLTVVGAMAYSRPSFAWWSLAWASAVCAIQWVIADGHRKRSPSAC